MAKYLLIGAILLFPSFNFAQAAREAKIIKLSEWTGFDVLDPYVQMYVDSNRNLQPEHFTNLEFVFPPQDYLNKSISHAVSEMPHLYKVTIYNDTPDTARYFFLALPQKGFSCYEHINGSYRKLEEEIYDTHNTTAARIMKVDLLPQEVTNFIIRLEYPFYYEAYTYLWMVPLKRINTFFLYLQRAVSGEVSFQWIICGMLAMMFLYIILKYVQIRSVDYLYYGFYILFFLIYFGLKLTSSLGIEQIFYANWYGGLLNNQLQVYAYIMYFLFFQSFLNTRTNMPILHRLAKTTIMLLIVYLVIDTVLFLLPEYFNWKQVLWDVFRIAMFVITFTAIIIIMKARNPLGKYLVVGGFILAFLGICAMIFSVNFKWISFLPNPLNTPITYFQIGVVAELICFTLGLGYKNRLDEQEKVRAQAALQSVTQQQEFERYRSMMEAREEERTRIAKDLHDGVGGLLSGVKLSLAQMQERLALNENDALIFARSLDMLDGSMQEIRRVSHAMMPPSLQQFGLTAAIRDYTEAINSMKTIEVVLQVVGREPESFTLDKQLMIYRIIQELVNNVLKHAHANRCLIQLVYAETLSITVEDDGVGFSNKSTHGAGISNIRQRVEFLKGNIDWEGQTGHGTSVWVEIPVN